MSESLQCISCICKLFTRNLHLAELALPSVKSLPLHLATRFADVKVDESAWEVPLTGSP